MFEREAGVATKWDVTRAVRASTLPPPSRLIMFVLADVADAGTAEIPPQRTPSLSVLAEETGLDRSTVRRHLSGLESAGWVGRMRPDPAAARAHGERTRYRLIVPEGFEPGRTVGAHSPYVEADNPQVGAEDPQGGGTVPPGVGAENTTGRGTVPPNNRSTDREQIKDEEQTLFVNPPTSTRTNVTPITDETFDRFWSVYPRKVAKGTARKAWTSALKRGASPTAVIAAAERYRDHHTAAGTEARFIRHAATWLNGENYDDEPEPVPQQQAANGGGYQPYRNPTDMSAYLEDL